VPLVDAADPRVATADVRLTLRGRRRDDLFAPLEFVLSERFAAVPRVRLVDDLLMPLKNALGNAQKHGNGNDPRKEIAVELFLAARGALVTITDEGPGFDTDATLSRLRNGETYFSNRGLGLRNLDRAASRVAWENGGRTLLLCYEAPCGGPRHSGDGGSDLDRVVDPAWMRAHLPAALAEADGSVGALESCRACPSARASGGARDIRYIVRLAAAGGGPPITRSLMGRLHATAAAAVADFAAARALHGTIATHRLRIPRPIARPVEEPRLALFEFHPWMSLADYLAHRGSLKAMTRSAGRVGRGLAVLHGARPDFVRPAAPMNRRRFRTLVGTAARNLRSLPDGADHVETLRRLAAPLVLARAPRGRPPVPIHGALGLDSVCLGIDRRFYLYRFEACRLGDAVIDLGAFAADLLWSIAAHHGNGAYHACLDQFLARYAAYGGPRVVREEIRSSTAFALLARLTHAPLPDGNGAGGLSAALAAL